MKKLHLAISLTVMTMILSGCGRPSQPPTGKNVTVQFRRDALGSAHSLPISPTTDSINGARVSLTGKLIIINEEWVVLDFEKNKHWIPRDAILLIRINK